MHSQFEQRPGAREHPYCEAGWNSNKKTLSDKSLSVFVTYWHFTLYSVKKLLDKDSNLEPSG